jgi:hypothetical protein
VVHRPLDLVEGLLDVGGDDEVVADVDDVELLFRKVSMPASAGW